MRKYLLWSFVPAWILQIIASACALNGPAFLFSPILAVSMFVPLLSAFISGNDVKSMGWKPRIRGNMRTILSAWFLPSILGTLGAFLFYVIFPNSFDTTFAYIRSMVGEAQLAQLEAQGMSLPVYAGISLVSALTYAPLLNMFFAVGEEAGWRGVLYPILKKRFGKTRGRIFGGLIWGCWHWPVMILTGYEYGTGYWGAPFTGMALFCVITTAMGVLMDHYYEKTESIWVPALCHGAINAFAGVPIIFLNSTSNVSPLLGPLMIGLIGGLPLILVAAVISQKDLSEGRFF